MLDCLLCLTKNVNFLLIILLRNPGLFKPRADVSISMLLLQLIKNSPLKIDVCYVHNFPYFWQIFDQCNPKMRQCGISFNRESRVLFFVIYIIRIISKSPFPAHYLKSVYLLTSLSPAISEHSKSVIP